MNYRLQDFIKYIIPGLYVIFLSLYGVFCHQNII